MISSFIWVHLPFYLLPIYFSCYTVMRVIKHWRDGKERVHTSSGRLIVKIIATICCAILELVHVADYSPDVSYSTEEIIFRSCYFVVSGVSWLFSAVLVYFDYNRRLKSQWRGQRLYWILQFFTNLILLVLNIIYNEYEYSGSDFFKFDLIQIISYVFIVVICALLTYYSVFRPNDFSVITNEMYQKLNKSSFSFDDRQNEANDSEINFRVNITGYKIKQVMNSSSIHYSINVQINESVRTISRSLVDFEFLDKSLREQFAGRGFPDFSIIALRNFNVDERGQALCSYLTALCNVDYMTPDLLNFLQIEGNYRDILTYKYSQTINEPILLNESYPRAESNIQLYHYKPNHIPIEINLLSTHLQWIVRISIPSYRFEESTQAMDYYVKCEIPAIGFEKTRPYKFIDFSNLHKLMKKALQPTAMIQFPSKSFSLNKKGDKEVSEALRSQLEYYLTVVFNDPAYICREALDFIGCDVDLDQMLSLVPDCTYRITEQIAWEGEISEDSTHFIAYNVGIGKKSEGNLLEKEWKFLRRYREFDLLNKKLLQRQSSWMLKNYTLFKGRVFKDNTLPSLPGKKISPLSTLYEIEERRNGLEKYLEELLNNPLVTCSFAFREFIAEQGNI